VTDVAQVSPVISYRLVYIYYILCFTVIFDNMLVLFPTSIESPCAALFIKLSVLINPCHIGAEAGGKTFSLSLTAA
jgi:hypothetical protein